MTDALNEKEVRDMCRQQRAELDTANARIRQLEDEVARIRYAYSSQYQRQAFKMLEAAWGNYDPSGLSSEMVASDIINDIKALEEALAAQKKREKANG